MSKKTNVLIMGAAGRDFHNFNTYFRGNERYDVRAFTAIQIPDIAGRTYPPELAGELYPKGIPIHDESELPRLIKELAIDEVVFAYSDIPHEYVMHRASLVNALGADFRLMGAANTQIKSTKPVVSICAVRTGCGKSQTTRRAAELLKKKGKKVVVIRHPMPYGDLAAQACQRFAKFEDMDHHKCTIEEREEYEGHIANGHVLYAGVDYEKIIRAAEKEADVILWDGGNNDIPFYRSDLRIVVTDPHRAGHELSFYPGETNLRMAEVVIINKVDTADCENIKKIEANIAEINSEARVIKARSEISVGDPEAVKGKKVLVVEDGPTLTHGHMAIGAGHVAAEKYGAKEIVDPRPYAVGSIKDVFKKFTQLEVVLPAMGYGKKQIGELRETINAVPCDLVLVGTPFDLSRLIDSPTKMLRVSYDMGAESTKELEDVLDKVLEKSLAAA